jgi:hypothetical protein
MFQAALDPRVAMFLGRNYQHPAMKALQELVAFANPTDQVDIVLWANQWILELGMANTVSRDFMESYRGDIDGLLKHEDKSAAYKMGEEIFQRATIKKVERNQPDENGDFRLPYHVGQKTTYRVMVLRGKP